MGQTFAGMVAELPGVTRSLLLVAALDDSDGPDEILLATSTVVGRPAKGLKFSKQHKS